MCNGSHAGFTACRYFAFGLGIPTMLMIPTIASSVSDGNTTPLILFSAGTVLVVSFCKFTWVCVHVCTCAVQF